MARVRVPLDGKIVEVETADVTFTASDMSDRVVRMIRRHRATIKALPPAAKRTPAQQSKASDARDWMVVCQLLLLASGAAAGDVLDDDGVDQEP